MIDYHDKKQKENIQEVLRQGAKSEFWQVICQRLQEHIDSVQRQIDSTEFSTLPAEEYKVIMEKLKSEKMDRIGLMDMPEVIANELEDPEFFGREEIDVYE